MSAGMRDVRSAIDGRMWDKESKNRGYWQMTISYPFGRFLRR